MQETDCSVTPQIVIQIDHDDDNGDNKYIEKEERKRKGAGMDAKAVRQIVEAALEARENAYAPYSGFSVGAFSISSK